MLNTNLNRRVLVIDDDIDVRQGLKDVLEAEGYTTYLAENGEQGLALLKESPPHLILLDLRMPKMDGWEFKNIIEKDSVFSKIPVLVFSAHSWPPPPGIMAQGFLSKPIDIENLLNRIQSFLAPNHG